MDRKIRSLVRQRKAVAEKAHRLLQAAVVEAYGRPGVYVTKTQVMKRSNITDQQEYQTIAKHLEKEG